MEGAIINILKQEFCTYVPIKNPHTLQNIYDLLCSNIVNYHNPQKDPILDLYYGLYCYFKKKYVEMKKYYELAMDGNESCAFFNLGFYYKVIEGNMLMMEKYYVMASKRGNCTAMNSLGLYYKDLKMYNQMRKYFLMAIDRNDSVAFLNYEFFCKLKKEIPNLIDLYIRTGKNYNHNLVEIYKKYLSDRGEISIEILKKIPHVVSNINYIRIIKRMLDKKLSLVKMHCEYSIGSSGFLEAMEDFEKIAGQL